MIKQVLIIILQSLPLVFEDTGSKWRMVHSISLVAMRMQTRQAGS